MVHEHQVTVETYRNFGWVNGTVLPAPIGFLIALSFGPTLVALLTDFVFHDEKAVHLSLAIVMSGGSILGLVSHSWGLGAYRSAIWPVVAL